MKRIIPVVVAVALLVTSFVLYSFSSENVVAGKSTGENLQAESVEDLIPLLSFLAGEEVDSSVRSELDPESATVSFITSADTSYYSSSPQYTGGIRTLDQNINRELTVYMTEGATLYNVKGTEKIYKESTGSDGGTKTYTLSMMFDLQVMVTSKNAYVNVKEFFCTTSEENIQIRNENTLTWIKMPISMVSQLVDLSYENENVLTSMGEMVSYYLKSDEFDNQVKIHELDEFQLEDVYQQIEGGKGHFDDMEVDFKIDLSTPSTPALFCFSKIDKVHTQEVNTSTSTSGWGSSGNKQTLRVTQNGNISQQIVISNIDNTEIVFDYDHVEKTVKDEKDFERLFMQKQLRKE